MKNLDKSNEVENNPKNVEDALKVDRTVDVSKKIVANDHSNQANDNSTLIVNNGNPNDAKVQLALKIEDLEAEKQKWIDDELAKHRVIGNTGNMIKFIRTQATIRYDARLASLRKAYDAL